MTEKATILVLVHPGSCCGSANFNIGRQDAQASREMIAYDLQTHEGPLFIIDSELSDEIIGYKGFNTAINEAVITRTMSGQLVERIEGGDESAFNQVDAIRELVNRHQLTPERYQFELTGAWYDPDGDEGCVNSVHEALIEMGFTADILDSAAQLSSAPEPDEGYQDGPSHP